MKLAFIGTYPPRECGIATFTRNLYESMKTQTSTLEGNEPSNDSVDGFIVAMNDHDKSYNYSEEVKLSIRQDHQRDYLNAAKFINLSDANVCVLEHEFGIYGGENGIYILPLLYRLEIPLVVTLHTVLKEPSYNEKAVLQEICRMASKVVVMSRKAIEFLITIYNVDKNKIAYIEHGVPDLQFDQQRSKHEFRLENRKLILTFGFIGRSKGIETVLKALPKVVVNHPEILYMILGKTHPNVLRHDGDEYRIYLQQLVKRLNLGDNVVFLNEFVNKKELFKYLSASDIYVTPYLNEAQITSGTLSYAVGVGSAVVSTPYWHAIELLADGRGRLFDFRDSDQLADIFIELLDKPEVLKTLRKAAYDYGKTITWPRTGAKYVSLVETLINEKPAMIMAKNNTIDPLILPPFSLAHINRLTDDTGIIQHAKFGIPNLKEGYCLDDNARALLMVLMAHHQKKNALALDLAPIYLSYIHYMQNEDGSFRNFLSFSRNFLDEVGSEDSFGRTIWALGYLLANAPNDAYYQTGKSIFFKAFPNFDKLTAPRSIANTMVGIAYYLKKKPGDESMVDLLEKLAGKLLKHYDKNCTTDWKWFETELTYDNAMLPLALLHAAEILNNKRITEVALESMTFLNKMTLKEGYLSVIGNEKWYKKGGERSRFAQQPLDALAMILMLQQAFHLTKDKEYLNKTFVCFMWFLGENDLRINLFDFETNGCCDGLENDGVNRNQGAESTLAYLISHLTVLRAFEESEKI